jgi:hypothetical protein
MLIIIPVTIGAILAIAINIRLPLHGGAVVAPAFDLTAI